MYLKRFVQLFVIFFVSLVIFALILEMNFGNFWLRFALGLLVAYIFLTLPLVLLIIFAEVFFRWNGQITRKIRCSIHC